MELPTEICVICVICGFLIFSLICVYLRSSVVRLGVFGDLLRWVVWGCRRLIAGNGSAIIDSEAGKKEAVT